LSAYVSSQQTILWLSWVQYHKKIHSNIVLNRHYCQHTSLFNRQYCGSHRYNIVKYSNTIQAPIIFNEDELFLQRAEGRECSICQQENHHLSQTELSTFRHNDGSKACQHVFCHAGLIQIRPIDGVLRCPTCRQTGEIVRHDIFPTRNDQEHFQDFQQ